MVKHPYQLATNRPNLINYFNHFFEKTAGGEIYPKNSKPQFDINISFDEITREQILFIY